MKVEAVGAVDRDTKTEESPRRQSHVQKSLWTGVDTNTQTEPTSDRLFSAFEEEYGVALPPFLQNMYRIQNGGSLRKPGGVKETLPLAKEGEEDAMDRICSLQNWASETLAFEAEDLDWIEEEVGDIELIFPVAYDGHVAHSLDYNQTNEQGEPSVVYFDFECIYFSRDAFERSRCE